MKRFGEISTWEFMVHSDLYKVNNSDMTNDSNT